MIKFFVSIAIAALFQGGCLTAKPSLGMWVWTQNAFGSEVERQKLCTFCSAENITHLDLSIKIQTAKGKRSVKNKEALKDFISRASQYRITINALKGDPRMFFERNHETVISELRTLLAFNESLPLASRLSGIKYDVEPYLTEEWRSGGEKREQVIRDYLTCLQRIKATIDKEAPDFTLSVDVPFWWDKPEFSITFTGKPKRFVEHVQDLTDYIGIMSYRINSTQVLNLVEHERTYAAKIGKSICPGLETIDLKEKKSRVSFFGTSPESFRKTVHELQSELSENTTTRCIMLHHYDSLSVYLKSK